MMPSLTLPMLKLRGTTLLANAGDGFAEVFCGLGGVLAGEGLFKGNPPSPLGSFFSGTTEGLAQDAVSRADLFYLDVAHGAANLLDDAAILAERVFPNTFPRDTRHVMVDLTRPAGDWLPFHAQALGSLAGSLQSHAEVTLVITPLTSPVPGQSIHHLRQKLGVSEILLLDPPALSSATSKGLCGHSLDAECSGDFPLATLLAAYAALQFLNVPKELHLGLAAKAGIAHLSGGKPPSWVEIQS